MYQNLTPASALQKKPLSTQLQAQQTQSVVPLSSHQTSLSSKASPSAGSEWPKVPQSDVQGQIQSQSVRQDKSQEVRPQSDVPEVVQMILYGVPVRLTQRSEAEQLQITGVCHKQSGGIDSAQMPRSVLQDEAAQTPPILFTNPPSPVRLQLPRLQIARLWMNKTTTFSATGMIVRQTSR
jgi:hypothetical protein